jgi:phosphatidylglycerophosphate synthase
MLDAPLRKLAEPVLAPIGATLARANVSANLLTVASFVAGLGAFAAIATHNYWWGLGLVAANRLSAGIDGPLARLTAPTDLGAFLETAFDAIVASGIAFAFALADPTRALASAFLIFGFVASGSTYLAFAAIDARRNAAARGPQSIRYPAGLVENAEVFFALALACALPSWFSVIAYVLGAFCFATAGMRIAEAVVRFR